MRTLGLLALALGAAGCASLRAPVSPPLRATADLTSATGAVVGKATLLEVAGGVRVLLAVRGLAPGPKGVHVHAVGRCEPPAFTTAGPHFDPGGRAHGLLDPGGPHAGDLPNVTVGADGTGRLESMSDRITLSAGPRSLLDADGSALVVHAGPDDFRTDPDGGSGARIACGVVAKAR